MENNGSPKAAASSRNIKVSVSSFFVRRAVIDDLDPVALLFDGYRIFYGKDSNVAAAQNFLAERFQQADTIILLCEDDNQNACGFTQLFPIFSSVRMKRLWLLNDLFVSPEFRGKGIAEKLIDEAKLLARNSGAAGLILQTAKTNAVAQRLYERTGFARDEEYYWYEWNAEVNH